MHLLFCLVSVMMALGLGFGMGRIKNSAKLAAIRAELDSAKNTASGAVSEWIKRVEQHL